MVRRVRERAIIACPLEATVQTRRTVRKHRRPLANECPQVIVRRQTTLERAVVLVAVLLRHGNRVLIKDPIHMGVGHDALVLRRLHARVPVVVFCDIQEHVANNNDQLGITLAVAHTVVTTLVLTQNLIHITIRLIHNRNGRHSRVLALAKFRRQLVEDLEPAVLVDIILEPVHMTRVTTVVIRVRKARHSVKLNDHLQSVLVRPMRCLLKLIVLVQLDVWIVVVRLNTPVWEWDTDMIQAQRRNLLKVAFLDEVVKMVAQDLDGLVMGHVLAE